MTTAYLDPKLPKQLPGNPMHWAKAWFDVAWNKRVQRNANAMTLVTVDAEHRPSARIVLCKGFEADPGYLVFYTNYRSRKIAELDTNPHVGLVFHWDAIGRQIRIEGLACRSPDEESDRYFATRDAGSQLGAWASDQSSPLASRQDLLDQMATRATELGVELDDEGRPRTVSSQDLHTGEAFACGRTVSSSGSKAQIVYMTGLAGHARSLARTTTRLKPGTGPGLGYSPDCAEVDYLSEEFLRCPFCNERVSVVVDTSSGTQSYIEDCQVCCRPMQLTVEADQGELISVSAVCAS